MVADSLVFCPPLLQETFSAILGCSGDVVYHTRSNSSKHASAPTGLQCNGGSGVGLGCVTGARVAVSPVPRELLACFNFGQGERGGFYECGHDNTITRVVTYSLYQTVFVNATTLVVGCVVVY